MLKSKKERGAKNPYLQRKFKKRVNLQFNDQSEIESVPSNNQSYIIIENVTKRFERDEPRVVLSIEELSISQGEFFCILGPSGCGKSTLLNLISGVLAPDVGKVSIGGVQVNGPTPSCIQLFQEYGLYPWRTVKKNVEFGLEMMGKEKNDISTISQEFIELVGLADAKDQYPRELSGGMRQRVALARALAVNPDILLMDEPFGALDSITRLRLQQELEEIWRKTKKTIVWVTHNIDEAIALGDRIAIMKANPGEIVSVIDVPMPRPRPASGAGLSEIKSQVLSMLDV